LTPRDDVITRAITSGRLVMIELKVRNFGNSLGVVLPKEVLNRLHTADGEALFLMNRYATPRMFSPSEGAGLDGRT
jgi:hypothetical protein